MTRGSFIPMSPEERPTQRVYEVVDLPATPLGLEAKLDWVEPFPDDRPKTTPRKEACLFSSDGFGSIIVFE